MFIAGLDDSAVVFPQFLIAALPFVRPAVRGVLEPFHADFIPVINAGHTGISHLEQSRHLETGLAHLVHFRRQFCPALFNGRHAIIIGCFTQYGNGSLHIMTADKVHHGVEIFLRIILPLAVQQQHGIMCRHITEQIVEQNLAQGIIHGRIHLLTAEIFSLGAIGDFIGGILPNLANHHGILIRLF